MELKTEKHHIAAGIGLLILIGFAVTNAVGQVTTQETGPDAINITTNDVTNIQDSEATFQATLEGFNSSTYDAALIYWNYSKDNSLDQPGPITVESTEKQRSVLQPNIDSNSQYDVEAYAEPIVWDDDSLMKNYQEALSRASNVGSFPSQFQPDFTQTYSLVQSTAVSNEDGLYVSQDGSKLAVTGSAGNVVVYNMTSPWDLSTTAKISDFSASYGDGIAFSPNGTKMFVSKSGGGVTGYDLNEPWNVSTASKTREITTDYGDGLTFSPMGTELLVSRAGYDDSDFQSFVINTPWDLDTASESGDYYSSNGGGAGLDYSSDGSSLVTPADGKDKVSQFNLQTRWSGSSSYYEGVQINNGASNFGGVDISPTGDRLFVNTVNYGLLKLER